MKKRLPVLLLALAMVFTFAFSILGCAKDPMDNISGGDTLRIRCWNDEFQGRFRNYYPDYVSTDANGVDTLRDGTKVEWIITANQNNGYQNALDPVLTNQKNTKYGKRVDMFLIEADYASKYVDTDYTLDVVADVGLARSDLADQYQYTKDIVTDSDGALKGTSWQATPGLFAYRRSIAQSVLGTQDPVEIQAKLDTWDKFDTVAAQMHDKEYFMLSGYDDSYRVFSNNVSAPWVNEDKEIVVDPAIERWITQTKNYTDKGYNNGTSLWNTEWAAGQGPSGKVFGYFFSTWGINFTLMGNSLADATKKAEVGNGIYGDWAVCYGPQSFYWGGTWICAAAGTDNLSTIQDIMYELTCNADVMEDITLETQDFTNNIPAMTKIATSDFKSDFLGGQNHVALFLEAAQKIDMSNITPYDQNCNENVQEAMINYFNGSATLAAAWDQFYTLMETEQPDLVRAD